MNLSGGILVTAIESTPGPLIQVRDECQFLGKVSRHVALAMIQSGHYIGVGSPKRVRHLRRITIDTRSFDVDPTFWDGRGVLRFWPCENSAGMVTYNKGQLFMQPDRPAKRSKSDPPAYWGTIREAKNFKNEGELS